MRIEAVIFDLDGTLTDTLEDLKNSVNFAMRKFGFPERTTDEIRSFVGNGVKRLIDLSVPESTSDEASAECLSVFRNHYKDNSLVSTKPYEGITEMLSELKQRGMKTAVVTNKMHIAASDIVERYFGNLVDFTVGQVDGRAQKPQPDGIFLALGELGVSKANSVYVGDSEVDCITARNAGIPCIGVTWGFRDRKVLEEHGAEYIIERPDELLELLA